MSPIQHLESLAPSHGLKFWHEPEKSRYCILGQGQIIATCLRATRAQQIVINGELWLIDEVTHKIHLMGEIKFAFAELI